MAPIQTKTGSQGAGTTIEITLDSAPTQNNFLVLVFGCSDTNWLRNITGIVQDGVDWSAENGYGMQQRGDVNDGLGHYLATEIWIGRITSETPAATLTATMDAHCNNYANVVVAEYSGLTVECWDESAYNSSLLDRNVDPYTGQTGTISQNSELAICVFNVFGETITGVLSEGFSIVASSGYVTLVEKDLVDIDEVGCMASPPAAISFVACIITLRKASGVPGLFHSINLYGENVNFSPSGESISVADMANQTVTITPAAGCVLTGVYVDGYDVGLISEYEFTNVMEDHFIEAYAESTAPPETEAFKALRRRFEGVHAGVDFQVTKQTLALGDSDDDTGWPVVSYTETTEKVIIVPKALQRLLIGLAPMVVHSAMGFAGKSYKQGDRIVNRYGFTWVVEACQAIKKLDKLLYYQLQLRQPFNWESFADPNANQVLNGGFEESSAGQPVNWNANMVSVGSGGRTGNCLLMNQQGYVCQSLFIPVNMIGFFQVYLLGGYIDPCFGGARSGTIEVIAVFDDEISATATYTSTDQTYELINLKPLLTGKATRTLTYLQLTNLSPRDIQIDDVGIFLAPPVLSYYDMLRRKLEQNGRASSNVILRVLTLSNSKDDDGWFIKSYAEETISAIILHDSARADAVALGLMPVYNLVAFTLSPRPKQGDQLQETGIYYNVDAATNHVFGDHLVYRELKLTQLPLEGKATVGNGGD